MTRELPRIHTEKIGKRLWRVTQPFFNVPVGFVTDGASIPRLFWWFLDPGGEAFEASVIHDYMLTTNDPLAHEYFWHFLRDYGVPDWKANIAYDFVRIYFKIKDLIK